MLFNLEVKRMNLLKAERAPKQLLTTFLANNEDIDEEAIIQSGYVVMKDQKIIGCFVLQQIESKLFWLKQLFIIKNEAMLLPILLKAILQLAERKYAKEVYVHSHQPMVDLLLKSLQFNPKENTPILQTLPRKKGTWWSYKISS